MKLPWVSREAFDALAASEQRWQEGWTLSQIREGETKRAFDALLEKYHALARPPEVSHIVPRGTVEKSEPSIIAKTIREESGGDIRLAHYFRKRVTQLRRENPKMTDEEIAEQIATWESTDTEATG